MNNAFVTQALQEDRYPKAIQLINQFETELRHELERIGDLVVEENPDLFIDDAEPRWNKKRSSRTILAFARIDYIMDRLSSTDEDAANLKLNISFQWVEPAEFGHHEVDGALNVASYKIKHASDEDHKLVKELTKKGDWPIYFAKDGFGNAPGVFYIPVETAGEVRQAHETLKDHFSKFGTKYGVDPT